MWIKKENSKAKAEVSNKSQVSPNKNIFNYKSEVFKNVDSSPLFPGCDKELAGGLGIECSKSKMMTYIAANLKYPEIAKEYNIQGRVIIQIIVFADGSIGEINLLKDIGENCGASAIQAVESMKSIPEKWTPGKIGSINVNSYLIIPVDFKL